MIQYAAYFYPTLDKFGKGKSGADLERIMRSRGIGFYALCELKGDQRHDSDKRVKLVMKQNREVYTKYNKEDLWVISRLPTFESSQTFLAKSTYFGPFADGTLDLDCLSPRDVRVATGMANQRVYALRTVSASTELMMLETLEEKMDRLPLLPYILNTGGKKKKDPLPVMDCIIIKREDGIDVERKLSETVALHHLNEDQER
ncbi:uncharacterized protein EV154DRAFT_129701 [Mucor mucedo]|uniref:uncharacterized protein n=1 Tax=Mucor mucedo TaxID=29922 RepID=UPI002220BA86|nr:uncharacterized protein EV154DRAFT_129701 [Mucor mucedo]KAI7869268.1 hypothetical protein EV154DRAFT_129701 [Mucor mucedo]